MLLGIHIVFRSRSFFGGDGSLGGRRLADDWLVGGGRGVAHGRDHQLLHVVVDGDLDGGLRDLHRLYLSYHEVSYK